MPDNKEALYSGDPIAVVDTQKTLSCPKPCTASAPIQEEPVHTEMPKPNPDVTVQAVAPELITQRPGIIVSGRPFRDYFAEAKQAVSSWNQPPRLFRRANELVRVADQDGRACLEQVGPAEILVLLSEAADFYKTLGVHVPPPQQLMNALLGRYGLEVPSLTGIIECPVLRPNGTILQEPGYDVATRLLYRPGPDLEIPAVPDHPTMSDVHAAVNCISGILCDFPFEDSASRANAVALLLTAPMRPAIDGCVPMAAISAPNPGSGKGLIASVAAVIATGMPAAAETVPSGDEEFRKKITALLRAGVTFILWDNVTRTLRSDALESALTCRQWRDRLLGRSESLTVQQDAIWIATGNNLGLANDLTRRCYPIRLISSDSRPWQRQGFAHPNLLGWVKEQRGEILCSLLTIARAWFVAGSPIPHISQIGNFERWAYVIGGVLEYSGVPDFLGNLPDMYTDIDEGAQQWAIFLGALRQEFGNASFTVAQLVQVLTGQSHSAMNALQDVLPPEFDGIKHEQLKTSLGKAFSRRKDVKHGAENIYLSRFGKDPHTKAVRWRVSCTNDAQLKVALVA